MSRSQPPSDQTGLNTTPIEKAGTCANTLKLKLNQRTRKLAQVNRQVKACNQRAQKQKLQLEEALKLQSHLRKLTRKVLSAQENDRKRISHFLQDEIAQTLLGLNTRLLSLKTQSRLNTVAMKQQIVKTKQDVTEFVNHTLLKPYAK